MKINRLIIHNIASILDTTIDFTTYPLAGESIFLITGNTGSGKTTVLNAICMALYDKVPALYNASGDKDTAGMSINSAMQLARRDADDCALVTLQYEGKDRKRYEITWRLNRITRGANKGEFKSRPERVLAQLDDDGREAATYTSVKEIDAKVLETVDLTFDQFCRTTMLAQGQFLKFLESTEREKCEILEKLTGTEIYKRIGEEVNAMYRASEAEYADMSRRLEEVSNQLLDDDALDRMRAETARLSDESVQLQSAEDEARRQIAWLEARDGLRAALVQSESRLAKAQANDVSAERRKVEAWDSTAQIRELLKRKKDLADQLNRLEQQRESLADDTASVHAGIALLHADSEERRRRVTEIDDELAMHEPRLGVYARLGEIKLVAENIVADLQTAAENDKKVGLLQASISEAAEKLSDKEKAFAETKKEIEKAKATHAELESVRRRYDISLINERKTQLMRCKEALAGLVMAHNAFEEKSKKLAESQSDLNAKRQDLEHAGAKLPELEKECTEAQERYKTLSDRLQGQMDLKDKLTQLKRIFHEDKKCPLCGSTDGHICTDSVVSLAIEEAQKKADDAREKWQEAQAALNEAKADVKGLNKEIARCEKSVAAAAEQLTRAAMDLTKAKAAAKSPEGVEIGKWSEIRLSEINSDIEACDKEHAEASKAIELCSKSQERLDLLRKRCDSENECLLSLRQKADKDRGEMEKHREMAASKRAEAKSGAEKLAGMLPDGSALGESLRSGEVPSDLDESIKRIESDKQQYESLQEREKSEVDCLKILQDKIARIEVMLESMPDLKPSTAADPHTGEDVMEMCGKLKDSYMQHLALLNNNAKESERLAMRESDYFQTHDREETMSLLDVLEGNPNDADAAAWRKTVQEHDSELKTAREFVDTSRKSLEEHMCIRPEKMEEETTAEDIKTQLGNLAERRRHAIEESTKIDAAIKRNDELKQKAGQELPKLKALEDEYLEWKEIDGMFGTTKSRNEFGVIAQRFIFSQLLERANEYLSQLNPRYSLKCRLDSMQIYVVDRYLGDAERVANGLSGGEGFIASLSLALALSSINTEREGVDTIFIDEGFGTLSSDLLQTVIDMLDRLQNGLGRRVGIISHIDFLKERIHTKICLEPIAGKSASTVSIVAE